uniref:Knottins-like domain-containing protein n=1 Tax=Aegilops tauschii subsp. strangulata TaxID=200361 RepID=A0A453PEL9_AEGTS
MGVIKMLSLLCLLLLMPLLLVPSLEAKTCVVHSRTYQTILCKVDPCVEACHKEGFTYGFCSPYPLIIVCFCVKKC